MIAEVAFPIPLFRQFDYEIPTSLAGTSAESLTGRRVEIFFGRFKRVGIISAVKSTSDSPPDKLKAIGTLLDDDAVLSPEQMALGKWLAERYVCSLGEALFALLPPKGKSTVNLNDVPQIFHTGNFMATGSMPHEPTENQKEVTKILQESLYSHQFQAFLLLGVAAAGKTEVYMDVMKHVLNQGKTVLFLTPEIGLAEQTYGMLSERFGKESVVLYHSDASLKDRVSTWEKIRRSDFPIVIGPRTAALTPLPHIGAIIMDEEHDSSFKEDRKPRYHARDVAFYRAKAHGALLVFGTATPSVDLMHEVQENRVTMLELVQRAVPSSRPHVTLIDLKKEKHKGLISDSLRRAIDDRLLRREQTILFLNRRGYHRYLKCEECSWIATCPKCGITLVKHKPKASPKSEPAKEVFLCHYCSFRLDPPSACPSCGKKKLYAGGFGTERMAEDIQTMFPMSRVLRWDRDAAATTGHQKKFFEEFLNHQYDILVGTQVVAYGFNFPLVTLVGILDADSGLHRPDFRAAEKTFQLLTQVAGRAGRSLVTGDVMIQSRSHDHYAISYAVQMDAKGFTTTEMGHRRELNYPPYSHLVQIITAKEPRLEQIIFWLEERNKESPLGIMGPMTAGREKSKGKPRRQVIVKVPNENFENFLPVFRNYIAGFLSDVSVVIDPESF